jgi:hypothetical protein
LVLLTDGLGDWPEAIGDEGVVVVTVVGR